MISIVLPVYNEAENIRACLRQLYAALCELPHEILVCYDFDGDTTLPAIEAMPDRPPTVRLVKNDLGKGVAFAMQAGFAAARGDVVVTTMADLSDPPDRIPLMAEKVRQGAAVVSGSRYMPGGRQHGGPLLKRTLSRLAGLSLHRIAGVGTHDATTNFRAYSAEYLCGIKVESTAGFELGLELTIKAHLDGHKVDQVPSTWHDRSAGQSRFRMWQWMPRYLKWYLEAMWAPLLVWATWLTMLVVLVTFLMRHAVEIPYWDENHNMPVLMGEQPVTLQWLWSQHNEHRIPLARLIYLGAVRASGYDLRAGMYVSVAFLSIGAAVMILTVRRIRGRTSWLDAFFPLALMQHGHFYNLLSSFQLVFTMFVPLTAILMAGISLRRGPPSVGQTLVIGLMITMLGLLGGHGILMVPPFVVWLGLVGTLRVLNRHDAVQLSPARRLGTGMLAFAFALIGGLFVVLYAAGYSKPPHHVDATSTDVVVKGFLDFLATSIGPIAHRYPTMLGVIALLVVYSVILLLWRVAYTRPPERIRAAGLAAVLAGLLLLMASIGYSRGPMGAALSMRYMSLGVPILCLVFVVTVLYGHRVVRWAAPMLLLAGAVWSLSFNYEWAKREARHRARVYEAIRTDARWGEPPQEIAERYYAYLHHVREPVAHSLQLFSEHRVGPYRNLPELPTHLVEVPVSTEPASINQMEWTGEMWRCTGNDPYLVLDLGEARHVAGVRVRFAVMPVSAPPEQSREMAWFQTFWLQRGVTPFSERRSRTMILPSGPHVQTRTVWIDDTLDTLRIDPDNKPCGFELHEVTLLLLPEG